MSSTTNLVTLSLPSTIENLAGEGIRWHDLIRHNTYVETLQQMFINDDTTSDQSYASLASRVTADSYLYPIPPTAGRGARRTLSAETWILMRPPKSPKGGKFR